MYENQIWTVAPKTSAPISFESAILWANQMGKAANEGFKIIFRQPRIHEFFADTPVSTPKNFNFFWKIL